MDSPSCPVCRNRPTEPINLRCEHHPCFACASSIMTLHQETDIQTKYKIVCPVCHTKTVTYDIRHLIVNNTEQDQDLYVTTKFLNQKAQVFPQKNKQHPKESNHHSTYTHSKKNSTHGIINVCSSNRPVNFECKNHAGLNLQYFCEECAKNASTSSDIFFCSECAKSHSPSQHRLVSIRQATLQVEAKNQEKKNSVLPNRRKELDGMLKGLQQRQEVMGGQFEKLYKDLNEQFKQIYQTINDQYESMKKEVKAIYAKQCEELKSNIQFIQRIKDSLSGLEKMYGLDSSDIENQVSFYVYASQIEKAIEVNKAKLAKTHETPKLVKKVAAMIVNTGDKLIELGYGHTHRKTMSKMVSPTNSARSQFQNYANDSQSKKSKGHFNIELYTSLKENLQIFSPKASVDFRV